MASYNCWNVCTILGVCSDVRMFQRTYVRGYAHRQLGHMSPLGCHLTSWHFPCLSAQKRAIETAVKILKARKAAKAAWETARSLHGAILDVDEDAEAWAGEGGGACHH